jgi:hypothetical protein
MVVVVPAVRCHREVDKDLQRVQKEAMCTFLSSNLLFPGEYPRVNTCVMSVCVTRHLNRH